jgi:Uma2 family endonuclease
MTTALEEIVDSPRLPQIVKELEVLLQEEAVRRERFRDELRDGIRAEFINGEIIVHSPERYEHAMAAERIAHLLRTWVQHAGGGNVMTKTVLVAFTRNDYMPDVMYFSAEQVRSFEPSQSVFPPPQLAVEILSASTEARDRGVRAEDYASHGVKEYWIVDAAGRSVEQCVLNQDRFELRTRAQIPDRIASPHLSGFSVPVLAFFDETENRRACEVLRSPASSS